MSMLKRYTHLRAARLVRKLEGNKHRGRQVVFDHLIPYPGAVEYRPDGVCIRLLDFEDLVVGPASSKDDAIRISQDTLLRQIVTMMRDSAVIPPPDQYLEPVPEERLVIIDPLATANAAIFLQ